jgi:tRNA 2-thiouridine synthesizing protein E
MSDGPETDRRELRVNGQQLALDADGHLVSPEHWDRSVAEALAARDGLVLGPDHWWLIEFVREHNEKYATPPLMRVVVAAWRDRQQDQAASSRAIYRLFPDNPVRQACCYGGLPKPDWCI